MLSRDRDVMIPSRRLIAALVAVVGTAAANGQTTFTDGFGDGDRDNDGLLEGSANDALDTGLFWYGIGGFTGNDPINGDPTPTLDVVDDTAGIGSGNALQARARGSSRELQGVLPSPLVLGPNDGDRIALSFDIRLLDDQEPLSELTSGAEFRFGLFDADENIGDGGFGTGDGDFDGDAPGCLNDRGFSFRIPINELASARLQYEDNNNTILGGSGDNEFIASGGGIGIPDTSATTIELVLTRTAGTSPENVSISLTVGGVTLADDTVGETTLPVDLGVIDYFVCAMTQDQDYLIDNFEITDAEESIPLPSLPIADGFEDGDYNNDGTAEGTVNDALDTGAPWVRITGTSDLTVGVIDDSGVGGIGTMNAVNIISTSSSVRGIAAPFETVTLQDGETLRFAFDVRFLTIPSPSQNDWRFGLYNDAGTQIQDGGGVSDDDDYGYYALFDTDPTSTATTARLSADPAGSLLGGSARSVGGSSNDPAFIIADTDVHSVEITIERTGDDNTIKLFYDGVLAVEGSDTLLDFPIGEDFFTFNQAVIGSDDITADYVVDNVVIELVTPAAPSSFDGFEDGDYNNDSVLDGLPAPSVNDPADTGFEWFTGVSEAAIVPAVVDDASGIGTGNAFSLIHLDNDRAGFVAAIEPASLANTGDTLSIEADFRFTFPPAIANSSVRFGAHNDNGTPYTSDDDDEGRDDTGYYVRFDAGVGGRGSSGVDFDIADGSPILSGSNTSLGSTSSGDTLIDDTDTRRFRVDISRAMVDSVDTIQVDYFVDGVLIRSRFDDALNETAFNQIGFAVNGQLGNEWRVDNVRAVFTPADAPAEPIPTTDGFEDGDRDNNGFPEGTVNDANDVGQKWYVARGVEGTEVLLTVSDDASGIGTGNVLDYLPLESNEQIVAAIDPVILMADGDSVTWNFDIRLDNYFGADVDKALRFGIHNDAGSPIPGDNSTSSLQSDDIGYAAWLDVGAVLTGDDDPVVAQSVFVWGDTANTLLGGASRLLSDGNSASPGPGGSSASTDFLIDDESARAVSLKVTRRFDNVLGRFVQDVDLTIDGSTVSGTDIGSDNGYEPDPANGDNEPADTTAVLTNTFNQLSFVLNGPVFANVLIDNIEIIANVTDCPQDLNMDGAVDFLDLIDFLALFDAQDARADLVADGMYTSADVNQFLADIVEGCE